MRPSESRRSVQDAGGFHRDVGAAVRPEPVGQVEQAAHGGRKGLDLALHGPGGTRPRSLCARPDLRTGDGVSASLPASFYLPGVGVKPSSRKSTNRPRGPTTAAATIRGVHNSSGSNFITDSRHHYWASDLCADVGGPEDSRTFHPVEEAESALGTSLLCSPLEGRTRPVDTMWPVLARGPLLAQARPLCPGCDPRKAAQLRAHSLQSRLACRERTQRSLDLDLSSFNERAPTHVIRSWRRPPGRRTTGGRDARTGSRTFERGAPPQQWRPACVVGHGGRRELTGAGLGRPIASRRWPGSGPWRSHGRRACCRRR
jgi:hypothetical protein